MYKIGEFSILSKTTIKTLRYYEKVGLLLPTVVADDTNYRYYDAKELLKLSKIMFFRQMGLSIKDIKSIFSGHDIEQYLTKRQKELEHEITLNKEQLSKLNYYMKEKNMKYEVIKKILPDYIVYYKEGIINDLSEMPSFIINSGSECKELNPNIKCIEPDYCFISYLDPEYKQKNISIRYSQAVTEAGNENENIRFTQLKRTDAICVYHKGSYSTLREAFSFLLKYIAENNYEITEPIRERYIDGIWNKDNEDEWLTEIQAPIKAKE